MNVETKVTAQTKVERFLELVERARQAKEGFDKARREMDEAAPRFECKNGMAYATGVGELYVEFCRPLNPVETAAFMVWLSETYGVRT